MRFKTNKGLVATSLALALASFGTAHATDTIQFDPLGTSGANAISVGSFDWAVNSALSDNVFTALASVPPGQPSASFQLYFHAALNGFLDSGGNAVAANGLNVANTGYEITVTGGFRETLQVVSQTATTVSLGANGVVGGGDDVVRVTRNGNLAFSAGPTNFISMFFDTFTDSSGLKSDALSGLGYNDGTKILSATVSSSSGTIATTTDFIDANNNGAFDAGETIVASKLDNFGIDQWPGILTAEGNGSTSLTADIGLGGANSAFFLTPILQLLQTLDFTTQTKVPFDQTNPSQSFDDGLGGVVSLGNGLLNVGICNGCNVGSGTGPDFLLQADASNAFTRAAVPEPSVLGLLGVGLMGLALSRRRVWS